ncbi:MAG: RNA 3'-terminal phosphate cyclase [Pseudomonadota bacterium]
MSHQVVIIEGSEGEGGGQMLRSALSLSMISGQPFIIKNIRSKRKMPGLMRQHLTCVHAAAKICDADIKGAELGSQELFFAPNTIKSGEYHFSIGTAGSTNLVAQTVIPALMLGTKLSTIILEGGTHNMQSPPFDFLRDSFFPILKKMGVDIDAQLHTYGFYPAGGGKVEFNICPVAALKPLELLNRGSQLKCSAEAFFADLSVDIPRRELNVISKRLGWAEDRLFIRQIKNSACPGNILILTLAYENVTETIASFGKLGVTAEKVATQACNAAVDYLECNAAVGVYLADQLLLPFALAGKGKFTTLRPSLHTMTNIEIIKKFISCDIQLRQINDVVWEIAIES